MKKANLAALLLSTTLIAPAQIITTAAGNSTWKFPVDVALDAQGNLYVSDSSAHVVYRVDRFGAATIFAGNGTAGFNGNGGPATSAQLRSPQGIAFDANGALYIADTGNHWVRRVAPNGTITTFAGSDRAGFSGDGGPATSARLGTPLDVAFDAEGSLYISEYGNARIRKVDRNGMISTFAGTGAMGNSGDGGQALLAQIDPGSITFGPDGALYFTNDGDASLSSGNQRVRKISAQRIISTVAGTGSRVSNGDGGPATAAGFESVDGIAVDGSGNIFLSEYWGGRVRKINPAGIITTYAGTGRDGYSGDDGPATQAQLNAPLGLTVDAQGSLLIADSYNARVRKVSAPPRPAISETNAVVPSFGGKAGFSSNTYVEIYGTNLAQSTRQWGGADFNGANAPTSLDGVSVEVNGKQAFIFFISPTQININTPDDTATGPVRIQVKNVRGESNIGMANRERLSPTLQTVPQLLIGGKQYVAALTPDFQFLIGRPNMIPGVAFRPAAPRSAIAVYALGCGLTNPATQAGVVAAQAARLASPFTLRIGGVEAEVTFAGAVANSIGLYQFNVIVPNLPAGDHAIELTVDSVANAQNLFLVVGQ